MIEEIEAKVARECALELLDKWNAPEAIVQYLKTGDASADPEALRTCYKHVARKGNDPFAVEATCSALIGNVHATLRAADWVINGLKDKYAEILRERMKDVR